MKGIVVWINDGWQCSNASSNKNKNLIYYYIIFIPLVYENVSIRKMVDKTSYENNNSKDNITNTAYVCYTHTFCFWKITSSMVLLRNSCS